MPGAGRIAARSCPAGRPAGPRGPGARAVTVPPRTRRRSPRACWSCPSWARSPRPGRPGRGGFRRSGPRPTSQVQAQAGQSRSGRFPSGRSRPGLARFLVSPGAGWPGSWGPRLIRAGPGATGCGRPDPRRPRSAAPGRGGTRAVGPGSRWPRPRSHGVRRPRSAGPGPGGACAVCPGLWWPMGRARRTRRGNSTCGAGPADPPLPSRAPAPSVIAVLTNRRTPGPVRKRGRGDAMARLGGTTAEPPTAGGPGLVLPRDRDPPGRGRMYRRTRSMSRSRISRTPSDRVPGCQGMTKQRERHLPLPAVTGYGCHAVTERLLLFTDEPGPAPAKLRACGWSVPYLRCSPWLSGCAGPGGHDGWPGPRGQRPRLPTAGIRRAAGDTLPPMTECHQPRRRCPKTGPCPGALTTTPTSSANWTGSSGAIGNPAPKTDDPSGHPWPSRATALCWRA